MLRRLDSMTSWNTCMSLPVYTMNTQRSFTPSFELLIKKNEICSNSKRKYPSGNTSGISRDNSIHDCARIRSATSTAFKLNRRRKRKNPKQRYPLRSFQLSQKRSATQDSTEGLNSFASCWTALWRFCFKN